jgi:hypothetical protein
MLGPQPVPDVGVAEPERRVLVDEVAVDAIGLDDVVRDVVEDREVGLRSECECDVGELVRPMLERRQHGNLDVGSGEAAIGHPGPEDRMHLRHVRAPQHEGVGGLDIVVAAHRLVGAERAHETHGGRGHAMARVGVEIVGAEAAFHQLECGVAFPDRPLARAEHADRGRPLVLQHTLELLGHDVERGVPGDARELAVLRVLAVLHPQQGRGQAIVPVHDLGQEVALDAVEALVHFGLRVAVGRDDAVVFHGHRDAAARAAKAARRLRPLHVRKRLADLRHRRQRDAGHRRRQPRRRTAG